MDYAYYLKIFGLKPNFSLDELKKSYKNAVKKWHPDNFVQETAEKIKYVTEKMQEINYAYEYLKSNKLNNQSKNNSKELSLRDYIIEKAIKLSKYLNLEFNESIPTIFKDTYENINFNIERFWMKRYSSKEEVDSEYYNILKGFFVEYKKLKNEYFKLYFINEKEINETINYKCYLKEFYEELEEIRKIYSKCNQFKKILSIELDKYKNYDNYDTIKSLIEARISQTEILAKKNNYLHLNILIKEMHNDIEFYFVKHMEILRRLEFLENFFGSRINCDSKKLFDNLNEIDSFETLSIITKIPVIELQTYYRISNFEINYDCNNLDTIDKLVEDFEKIMQKIIKDEERNMLLKENEVIVDKLYSSIISKSNEIFFNLKISNDMNKITYVFNTLKKILVIFKKYYKGELILEELLLLKDISFTNIENDVCIFETIDKSIYYINNESKNK